MKKKKVIAMIAALCIFAGLGGVVYYTGSNNGNSSKVENTQTSKDKDTDKNTKKSETTDNTSDDILADVMTADYANKYVKTGDYKSLDYTIDETVSTDETVNNRIRYNMMLYTMDKIPKITDRIDETCCISYEITDKSDPENPLGVVENKMLNYFDNMPDFKEQLTQHKSGDTFETTYNYNGKDIDASIRIFLVVEDPLKYFDNDWVAYYVKQYSENNPDIKDFKTTDDYIAYVKKELDSENTTENNQKRLDAIYSLIVDKSTINEFSEDDIKKMEDEIMGEYNMIQSYSGVDMKSNLMKYNNLSTDEDFNNWLHEEATEKMKRIVLYTAIANQENIMPSEKEWKTKLEDWDKNNDTEYMSVSQWGENRIKEILLEDIVNRWLLENN